MTTPQKVMSGAANCQDVLQCMFGLSNLDIAVLKNLIKKKNQKTRDLAKKIRKDRSIVHRSLHKLISSGLVIKEKQNLPKGGYYHVYSAVPEEKIKLQMQRCARDFYDNMLKLIDEFEL
jgi:predicted transcriptional regulator